MCVAIHFSLVFVCVCVHSLLNSSPNTRSLCDSLARFFFLGGRCDPTGLCIHVYGGGELGGWCVYLCFTTVHTA